MTHDNLNILSNLTIIFRDVFDKPNIELVESMTANDVQGWDSLAHIRLMVTIEKHFLINFSASEISDLNNIGEMILLIEKKCLKPNNEY